MLKRFEKLILFIPVILAIGLGFWGFARAGSDFSAESVIPFDPTHVYVAFHHGHPWLEAVRCLFSAIGLIRLYDLFQPGKAPWQLILAQVLVPGLLVFSGAQLLLDGFRKNLSTTMARRKNNHVIVCGVGDVGMQIIQNLRTARHRLVAIDLVGDSANAATCEKSGVPLLQGDAKNPQVLAAAGIRRAQTAIVCTGSDSENIDIALQINALHARFSYLKPDRIQVLARLRNDWMHKRLIGSDKRSLGSAHVDLRLFNPFTDAARMLIKRLHLPPSPEFEARTFVLIGFGAYGREIALHLIRSSPVAVGETLKIIVFDQDAESAREKFSFTNPTAAEMASIEFVSASVAPGSPDLTRIVERKLESAGRMLGIALALGDDELSLCAALEVRSLLDRNGNLNVPVYVRLEHYRRLGELLRDIESISGFGDRLQIFGTLEETLGPDVLLGSYLDAFAQALHDDYRHRSQDTINPQANVPFHDLPEFMKMSNRWQADHTPLLMELAGIHLERNVKSPAILKLNAEQIERLSQLEHRRYTFERRLVESRFGTAQRQSVRIKQWNELSEDEKNWNRREIARLPEIMAGLGIELHPVRVLRLYGKPLAAAAQELQQFLAAPRSEHCSLIVDLDDAEATRAAAGALAVPSLSLWLFSNTEPREFALRKPQAKDSDKTTLIQHAKGWTLRDRVTMHG